MVGFYGFHVGECAIHGSYGYYNTLQGTNPYPLFPSQLAFFLCLHDFLPVFSGGLGGICVPGSLEGIQLVKSRGNPGPKFRLQDSFGEKDLFIA